MQEKDYKWFLENYKKLHEQYGNAYLVIKNQSVIGVYSTYAEGVQSASQTEEEGTFIVQYCNGQDTAYTNFISSMNFLVD